MKQLLFTSLFLLFSCKIMAQSDLRLMGFGINFNYNINNPFYYTDNLLYNPGEETGLGILYYYNSFHQIKNSPLYFTTGSKIVYNTDSKVPYLGQRFGIGVVQSKNRKNPIYYSFGGEINVAGLGIYGNANIIFKHKNIYYAISSEINYVYYNYYDFERVSNGSNLLSAGCGIGMGWDKKEFIPKENKKYAVMNHFTVNMGVGSFNKKRIIDNNLKTYTEFLDINANYRLFSKKIISPEVGIGLMVAKGRINTDISRIHDNTLENSFWVTYGLYSQYKNIMPYMRLGVGVQTRRKTAFIGNISIWSLFNLKTVGSHASIGLKYGINHKIAFSLSPSLDSYYGYVYGKYQVFEKDNTNSPYQLIHNTKGLHKIGSYGYLYGMKFGVHF